MLQSLPLVSCTFSFITLSLTGSRKIAENHSTGELEIETSLLDHYSSRTTDPQMNILTFASDYSVCRGQVRKRPVRTFPTYSSDPNGENYGLYCKYQLLKYRPWNGTMSSAWGGLQNYGSNSIMTFSPQKLLARIFHTSVKTYAKQSSEWPIVTKMMMNHFMSNYLNTRKNG